MNNFVYIILAYNYEETEIIKLFDSKKKAYAYLRENKERLAKYWKYWDFVVERFSVN